MSAFLGGEAVAQTGGSSRDTLGDAAYAVLKAEHTRAPDAATLQTLVDASTRDDAVVRRLAVRGLGRLERPSLLSAIIPLLKAPESRVRLEAANAVAQAVLNGAAADVRAAVSALDAAIAAERDPEVRAVIARSIGRLSYEDAESVLHADATLRRITGETPAPTVLGGVKGFEALTRLQAKRARLSTESVALLETLVTTPVPAAKGGTDEDRARIRRLALAALVNAGAAAGVAGRALSDPDVQVRRLATLAVASAEAIDDRLGLLQQGLRDASGSVRFEAVRGWAKWGQQTACGPVLQALDDRSAHVSLLAIDQLGEGCGDRPQAVARLSAIAAGFLDAPSSATSAADGRGWDSTRSGTWHRGAHALVSLSRLAPEAAAPLLPRYVRHPVWQVRAYAARAAAAMRATPVLQELAADRVSNVRSAAIGGLSRVEGHALDATYISTLGATDYGLVMAASRALTGTPLKDDAVRALLAALRRITDEGKDTSRDPRVGLLDRLRELGAPAHRDALTPYLADRDPFVAAAAARALQAWVPDAKPTPNAAPMPEPPFPSIETLRALQGARARITMAGLGSFEIAMFPEDAPATVARVVERARAGYYNGLTFHRVVPNYLVQGGSPGANELAGDTRYMRDELGLRGHRRGTIGISTRGRDTGDAQMAPDLVENPRLDHAYTVWAEVTSGIEVLEAVLEGDVIERIEILAGR